MPPKSERSRSSITFLRDVPGETSFMKSRNVFSFSAAMYIYGVVVFIILCAWGETIENRL